MRGFSRPARGQLLQEEEALRQRIDKADRATSRNRRIATEVRRQLRRVELHQAGLQADRSTQEQEADEALAAGQRERALACATALEELDQAVLASGREMDALERRLRGRLRLAALWSIRQQAHLRLQALARRPAIASRAIGFSAERRLRYRTAHATKQHGAISHSDAVRVPPKP